MAVETGDKITRRYDNFRGVDFRSDECALNRSPDALNVWRDYKELAGIKTRPALSHICRHPKRIKDMKWHGNILYYYAGDGSYHKVIFKEDGTLDNIGDDLYYIGDKGVLFEFDGSLYALGNSDYIRFAGDGEDAPFIPTTSIGALPDGTGRKTHQDVNLLTPTRINTFHVNEDTDDLVTLHLDTENVDKDYMPEIKIDGEKIFKGLEPSEGPVEDKDGGFVSWFFERSSSLDPGGTDEEIRLYYEYGVIVVSGQTFTKPKTAGQDNIEVTFKKTTGGREKILGCTIVQEFDNRIFLSGNPDYPNLVFHSSLSNPMYFSDLDVYEDGKDDGKIRAMVAGNGALWVFRDTDKGNGVYYHSAAFDATYGKVYPSTHSNIPTGCVGGAINFLDDIVFFSRKGMESVSQNVEAEQFATHKSSVVDRKMSVNPNYKDMVFAEWEGYLLVFIGTDVFLADSRAIHANENHYEYEWYHWTLGKYKINCAAVHDGVLYIGTDGENDDGVIEGHIYALKRENGAKDIHADDPNGVPIESYWTTPKDKFASPNKLKTTNKKGCIVEAVGDVTLSAKVENSDFETVGEYTGITDHFVSRIKRKKFKDIQLKFHSNTEFRLESATLEAFIGSFIKQ